MAYPVLSLSYRSAICLLIIAEKSHLKSEIFHLLTLLFTCYLAGCSPFRGRLANARHLINSLFMLVLACMISVVFSGALDAETAYSGGMAVAGFICFATIVNLFVIMRYMFKASKKNL